LGRMKGVELTARFSLFVQSNSKPETRDAETSTSPLTFTLVWHKKRPTITNRRPRESAAKSRIILVIQLLLKVKGARNNSTYSAWQPNKNRIPRKDVRVRFRSQHNQKVKSKALSAVLVIVAGLFGVSSSSVYAQQSKKASEPTTSTRTNEWPQFRGPNGTGVAEGFALPSEFSSTKNLVWKTPVPFARSSPVVTADRVFLTASEGDKLITLALDRKTGKLLWRRDVARVRHMPIYKANDAASPSPVSDGKNVFVFFAELGLISYGPDGKERWRVPLGPFNSFYGMGGSPVLAGNTLVMVCDQRTDSFIIAIDARNGKELWKKSRPNYEAYSTPAIYKPKDGPTQVIVLGSHTVDAYSLDKGERLWWVTRIGSYPKGVPVVGTDMVYVTADAVMNRFCHPSTKL
jgi:outer membrane protein assembly factor BamB